MSFGVGGQQEGISRCLINLALDPRAAGALAEGIREAEEHSKGNSGTSVRRSILAPATRRVPNTHCIVRVIPAPCAVAGWRRHSQGALHARIKVAQPHDAESSVGDKERKPLALLLLLLLPSSGMANALRSLTMRSLLMARPVGLADSPCRSVTCGGAPSF